MAFNKRFTGETNMIVVDISVPPLLSCNDGQIGCKSAFGPMKYHAFTVSMDCEANQVLVTKS